MGLFKPGWMSADEAKAARALAKVSDDATLLEIAEQCPHRSVQLGAVRKITGQGAILDVLCDSRIPQDVQQAALERASQPVLADAVRSRYSSTAIKLQAIAKLDESGLTELLAPGSVDNLSQKVRDALCERLGGHVLEPFGSNLRCIRCGSIIYSESAQATMQRYRTPVSETVWWDSAAGYNRKTTKIMDMACKACGTTGPHVVVMDKSFVAKTSARVSSNDKLQRRRTSWRCLTCDAVSQDEQHWR